jgi:hypothetical protein
MIRKQLPQNRDLTMTVIVRMRDEEGHRALQAAGKAWKSIRESEHVAA